MARLVLLVLALALGVTVAVAYTGKQAVGPLFAIAEPDLLAHIELAAKARGGDAQQAADRARAIAYMDAPPPVPGLRPARVASQRLFDPTVRLRQAVTSATGQVLHLPGTAVNPLDLVRLDGRLVLIDARVAAEVELAARLAREAVRTRVVLVGGSPREFARVTGVRPFFDQHGAISKRLGLRHHPAVVSQQGRLLRIQTLVLAASPAP